MKKAFIFDVDGTILNSMIIWVDAGKRYLEKMGVHIDYDLGRIMFELTMLEGAKYLKERHNLVNSIEDIMSGINGMVYDFYRDEAVPKENVMKFIEYAYSQGIEMTVATSTDRPMIETAFHRLGLMKYFKEIFTTSEVGQGKDKPEIFYRAMKTMGSSPEDTWLFDDALYSLRTAHKAGIKTVGIYDFSSEEDTEKIKEIVDIYVRDWNEYENVIGRIGF